MPEQEVIERAKQDKEEGKSPSTQAGEFVREEMHHIREGKHGAANTKQAIAIGLSKARRAGVELSRPNGPNTSERTRKQAQRDSEKGRQGKRRPSRTRSRAVSRALKREGHSAASPANLSRQAKGAARKRGARARKAAARRAVRTKGSSALRRSARKAARSRK
ncbi:MAG TPA: hypothetical protein VH140_14780 [Candidatus Acidoferrum sp.]|nr:hypothetical protein [Candidatus Acidoferrum sp.]